MNIAIFPHNPLLIISYFHFQPETGARFQNMATKRKYVRADYVYQPWAGLKTDLEDILWRFVDTETVRYEQFVELWNELNFSQISSGRQNELEAREVRQELFALYAGNTKYQNALVV